MRSLREHAPHSPQPRTAFKQAGNRRCTGFFGSWTAVDAFYAPHVPVIGARQKRRIRRLQEPGFTVEVHKRVDRQKFHDMLRSNEVTVVTKRLRFRSNKCKHCKQVDMNIHYQKGVDVAIVTELMSLGFEDAYDVAIIVSGDNDFVDAVNHVKSKGRRVWVASFSNRLGQDLMRSADRVIHLENISERIIK